MNDDNQPKPSYNKDDFSQVVEKIDLKNLPKRNHTEHEHVWVKDPNDETETYYAMKCAFPKCFRGYLVAK
jgi:hypothetical protein